MALEPVINIFWSVAKIVNPLALNSWLLILNPPIFPCVAVILPDITIPALDADNAVKIAAVLISRESLSILICCPDVSPIVVVEP